MGFFVYDSSRTNNVWPLCTIEGCWMKMRRTKVKVVRWKRMLIISFSAVFVGLSVPQVYEQLLNTRAQHWVSLQTGHDEAADSFAKVDFFATNRFLLAKALGINENSVLGESLLKGQMEAARQAQLALPKDSVESVLIDYLVLSAIQVPSLNQRTDYSPEQLLELANKSQSLLERLERADSQSEWLNTYGRETLFLQLSFLRKASSFNYFLALNKTMNPDDLVNLLMQQHNELKNILFKLTEKDVREFSRYPKIQINPEDTPFAIPSYIYGYIQKIYQNPGLEVYVCSPSLRQDLTQINRKFEELITYLDISALRERKKKMFRQNLVYANEFEQQLNLKCEM